MQKIFFSIGLIFFLSSFYFLFKNFSMWASNSLNSIFGIPIYLILLVVGIILIYLGVRKTNPVDTTIKKD